jgi:hypothetical protein
MYIYIYILYRHRDSYKDPLSEEPRTVKIKQNSVTMGDRTTHRTLSPERTAFQNGINK